MHPNPLHDLKPDMDTDIHTDVYYQALYIRDKIEKAKKYNQTWSRIPLSHVLYSENKEVLERNGFQVRTDGMYHIFVYWD